LDIRADVYRPDNDGIRPVAGWIHGGALIMGHRSQIDMRAKDLPLNAGYTVVSTRTTIYQNAGRRPLIRPDSVIWDFNGTILDDVALAAASISELLRRRNLPTLDVDSYRRVFRFPISEFYQTIGLDLSVESLPVVSDEFHELYLAGVGACSLNDGVIRLLEFFRESNIPQFILSAAEQVLLESWIRTREIEPFFDGIFGLSDRLARSKTDRGIELLSVHSLDSSRALFIGDTDHDAEVARALGGHSVAVLRGHQGRDRFVSHSGDIFEDFDELMSALSEDSGRAMNDITGETIDDRN
jgi:phosphoglycolate phosphatase